MFLLTIKSLLACY